MPSNWDQLRGKPLPDLMNLFGVEDPREQRAIRMGMLRAGLGMLQNANIPYGYGPMSGIAAGGMQGLEGYQTSLDEQNEQARYQNKSSLDQMKLQQQMAEFNRKAKEDEEFEKVIAEFPPDQQRLARLNRNAFVEGMMKKETPQELDILIKRRGLDPEGPEAQALYRKRADKLVAESSPIGINISNVGNPQLSPWENKALDDKMGTLAGEYFQEYRDKWQVTDSLTRNIERIDKLLEGDPSGALQDKFLAAEKALQTFGLTTPKWDESIGRREVAEMIAIQNGIIELKKFKGSDTEFEFLKGMAANPTMLTSASGRKTALAWLQQDARRARSNWEQVQGARKGGYFDATFVPQDPQEEGPEDTPGPQPFTGADGKRYIRQWDPDSKQMRTYPVLDE